MSRSVILILVENGAVQSTAIINAECLEPLIVDWDDLEVDPEGCHDLLDTLSDLPNTEDVDAICTRLNSIIDGDETSRDLEDKDENDDEDDENDGPLDSYSYNDRSDDDDNPGNLDDDGCCPYCGLPDCIGECGDIICGDIIVSESEPRDSSRGREYQDDTTDPDDYGPDDIV